jgi:hypothetical protein
LNSVDLRRADGVIDDRIITASIPREYGATISAVCRSGELPASALP